jgi:hypothetical protein
MHVPALIANIFAAANNGTSVHKNTGGMGHDSVYFIEMSMAVAD